MALCRFWQRWLIIKLGTVINLLVVCLWNSEETTAIKRDFSPAALLEKHRSKLNSEIVVFIAYADDKIFISAWQHFFFFFPPRNFADISRVIFYLHFALISIWIVPFRWYLTTFFCWVCNCANMNFSQQNIILNMEKNYRKPFFPNASIIIYFCQWWSRFWPESPWCAAFEEFGPSAPLQLRNGLLSPLAPIR